ncbi:helix-turn-helix domain-containing protein [Polaribacter porphyrae]|uniref:DNA-binding protein n=1 Tax=Polaribacter porphyrae TaxID=1137780 RepID=A0A2S7WRC8_9FLAO|nr:helix-turn-helix domain-containing protein [Polaribacter porphyrae]PQJ80149.1 DNA-binding protein [Polaribacter porphyrae]
MDFNIYVIIGLLSTFVTVLLAIFILSVSSKNKISNILFAIFLILNAFEFSGFFLQIFFEKPNNFLVAKDQFTHLTLPTFFLYILSVCYSDFRIQKKHLWHTIPFFAANFVMIPRFYLSSTDEKIALYKNFNSLYEIIYIHISLHLQSIIYIVLGFIVLKRAKKIFLENYSNNNIKTYKWLFQLLLFMSFLYGVAIIKNSLKFFGKQNNFQIAQIGMSIAVLSFACWYVLKALRNPNLFSGVNSNIKLITDLNVAAKNNINREEIDAIILFMKTEKPYLNPSLTIRNLAEKIKMNPRDLSVLINQHLEKHFFDFINEFRIEEAKKILKNPEKKEFTVLEILYDVGFNSKSSFNTAFKKHTGLTPTQYRKTA